MTTLEEKECAEQEVVLDKIFTLPNIISFARLCLVPIFLYLLIHGSNLEAALLFAFASATDFVDGYLARRTHCVSKVGQLLDPAVDRILMISGVLGLLVVNRLPLWVVVLVLLRDAMMLIGGSRLYKKYGIRVPVILLGKFATACLFIGCADLLLNWPVSSGLGWVSASWLPGFNGEASAWGIWFIYIGLVCALGATSHYVHQAFIQWKEKRQSK